MTSSILITTKAHLAKLSREFRSDEIFRSTTAMMNEQYVDLSP
jgi:hypothetical protein